MARDRPASPWIAFAAGAAAMLAVALLTWAWLHRQAGADLARAAMSASRVAPDFGIPPMPDAPRIPDAPLPRPK
jgi:hypothetical protein